MPDLTKSQAQLIENLSTQAEPETRPKATGVDSPHASHIIFDGLAWLAPNEHYVDLAERATLGSKASSRPQHRVCKRADGVPGPVLRCDRENRILVYSGSFNPPCLGHAILLLHAFLSTDTRTIAALIVNMDTSSLHRKAATDEDGNEFQLTSHQRSQL